MNVVHMVICRDCGYPAFEIERNGSMRKYYCKRCKLKFIRYEEEKPPRKREF